jgi:general secretion pathway protein H
MSTHASIQRAFTLVEVLVVVAIIAIAGAVVVPSMKQTGSMSVQAAGRQVIADLLVAQNDAIAKQLTRKVVFDPDNNTYKVTAADGSTIGMNWMSGDASAGNYIINFSTDDRFSGVRIENVEFGDDKTIAFDPLGAPDTGGTIDVVFGQFRYRVTVTAMTGRVTIAPVTGG